MIAEAPDDLVDVERGWRVLTIAAPPCASVLPLPVRHARASALFMVWEDAS